MHYSILGMEPISAFFLLHVILLFLIIVNLVISKIKKLKAIKYSLQKASLLLLLTYFGFHAFCVCMIFISIFSSNISTEFWLVFYIKFWIAMGLFIFLLLAIAVFLMPFGIFALILNTIKNVAKL